ncbi:MAG: exo-alpha-sialidase [Dehalococcoidia bacterium]
MVLTIGTHKGGFTFRSTRARQKWTLDGPFFAGTDVHHLVLDTRAEATLHAAVNSPWWGSATRSSRDLGATWDEPAEAIRFDESAGRNIERIWQITPGGAEQPGVLYAGCDPGVLFRSDDGGACWSEVQSLTGHSTRDQWNPGAGGLMVHSIVPYAGDPGRVHIGISAAGTFETADGGQTWTPRNHGVLADFMPEGHQYPEVGQCVHHLEAHPSRPDMLYQQNHAGVYRSDNAGVDWTDISEGLPSRFGFPLLVHPQDPDTVFVIPEQGPEFRAPAGGRFAIYRSRDRGAHWEQLTRGLPEHYTALHVYRQAMAADPGDPAGLYVGTSTGQLFASFDDGDSWELLWDMLPPIYSLEAAQV